VHPTKGFTSATPSLFEEHLRWLSERTLVVPFSKIFSIARTNSRQRNEKPIVAITFDDGYADNYEYAFPLLQKYRLSAAFFITAGLIERDRTVVERFLSLRRCCLEDIESLSWEQVREMQKTGMEIGSHTWSHPNLARLEPTRVESELRRSKEIIEERLGVSVDLLAYPFGKYKRHFTAATMEIAWSAGFRYGAAVAFRAIRPSDSPLALPRFFVTRDSVKTLAQKVYGAWDWLGWWHERVPLWLARLISRKDFEV
jgi:peptidoglycan/xylan/chitin deacetylase (PgdA/CDA1 family)